MQATWPAMADCGRWNESRAPEVLFEPVLITGNPGDLVAQDLSPSAEFIFFVTGSPAPAMKTSEDASINKAYHGSCNFEWSTY